MKVKTIEPYKAKDGSDRWRVRFEERTEPLILGQAPKFGQGTDIAEDKVKLIQKDDYSYFVWKEAQAPKKSYQRSPEETSAIQAQVAVKILADIFIAGKIKELQESNDYLASSLREWLKAALMHDPLTQKTMEHK